MKRVVFAGLLCLSLVQGADAGERFEPGLWRSTAVVGGGTGRVTGPRCVTAREAQSMNGSAAVIGALLAAEPDWQGCTIRDVRAEGMQVDFTAVCADSVVTTSQTTYRGSSYEGTIGVTRAGSPVMAMSIKGERLGACP